MTLKVYTHYQIRLMRSYMHPDLATSRNFEGFSIITGSSFRIYRPLFIHSTVCCNAQNSGIGQQNAFEQAKQALSSSSVVIHYDLTLPLQLTGDASAYGIGAVISHVLSEKPIAFASRTLYIVHSEQNYAQIEKEALSLVFGVKKFHQYLYGRKFDLITDHKPLTVIFGTKKGIPSLAAARLQRWAILLSAYQYDIHFKVTDDHANADGLSQLPLPTSPQSTTSTSSVFNLSN